MTTSEAFFAAATRRWSWIPPGSDRSAGGRGVAENDGIWLRASMTIDLSAFSTRLRLTTESENHEDYGWLKLFELAEGIAWISTQIGLPTRGRRATWAD